MCSREGFTNAGIDSGQARRKRHCHTFQRKEHHKLRRSTTAECDRRYLEDLNCLAIPVSLHLTNNWGESCQINSTFKTAREVASARMIGTISRLHSIPLKRAARRSSLGVNVLKVSELTCSAKPATAISATEHSCFAHRAGSSWHMAQLGRSAKTSPAHWGLAS